MHDARYAAGTWVIALALTASAACASPPASTPLSFTAAEHRTDAVIRDAVTARLAAEDLIDTAPLDIQVHDGIVELDGETDRLLAKERAGELAQAVRGVRGVLNRVRVSPPRPIPDRRLAEQIRDGLAQEPATALKDIEVSVDDGAATLTGKVGSWPERRIAGRVVKAVPGAKALENRLVVAYVRTRSDAEIQADVSNQLRWDARLAQAPIRVSVDEATVRLTGRVGSVAQRHWAASHAWVNGVDDVDVSGLGIDPTVAKAVRADLRPARIPTRDDAAIADALSQALRLDPRVSRKSVVTQVQEGWITLNGVVATDAARRSAESVARQIIGVGGVTNRLRVAPVRRISDERLRKHVKAALNQNPITTGNELVVGVDDGAVSLYGNLSSQREMQEALRVAAAVAGVKTLSNEIELSLDTRGDAETPR